MLLLLPLRWFAITLALVCYYPCVGLILPLRWFDFILALVRFYPCVRLLVALALG